MEKNFIDVKDASGKTINYDEYIYGKNINKSWLNTSMDNGKNKVYFGNTKLSYREIQQNLHDISEILEGRESIDFAGSYGMYSGLFNYVAQNKKVRVQYIDPRLEPTEIENSMISDTLVVAELPEEITQNITNWLSDKKNVIIGTLYKEELVDYSSSHK